MKEAASLKTLIDSNTVDCAQGEVEVQVHTSEQGASTVMQDAAIAPNATFADVNPVAPAPQPQSAAPQPAATAAPVAAPTPTPAPMPTTAPTPATTPAPQPQAAAPAAGADPKEQLRAVMADIIGQHGAPAIQVATEIAAQVAQCGINDVPDAMVPTVIAQLQARFAGGAAPATVPMQQPAAVPPQAGAMPAHANPQY